jgi:predicted RNA-binding Zn-ribbon protein involved in translation (DUF1610 family)
MNTSLQRKTSILKCPSCGTLLSVSPDMESFACKHCAAEQIVVRQGGTTVLKRVPGAIRRVQIGRQFFDFASNGGSSAYLGRRGFKRMQTQSPFPVVRR